MSDELSFFSTLTIKNTISFINSTINYPDAISADHKYSINRQNTAPALKICIPNEFPI